MSDTPENFNQQLSELATELSERTKRSERVKVRMKLWNFIVKASYALKRLVDIVASGLAIILLSPFLLTLALAVKISSPGPAIYTQVRVGRYGRHFKFYKFRTMCQGADKHKDELMERNESRDGVIFKMRQDPRITPLGRFLRRSSLDELPQLFNVFIGDMSLVGPRPPLPKEVAHYTLEDRKRLNVIPGLTCLWQISGRSDIPFTKQVQLDKEYIQSRSFWKDISILLRTIPAILTGRGAY
jgi:lipopolysaccharide/colanic/teichoic acid biosynthesis glycosyltransferase